MCRLLGYCARQSVSVAGVLGEDGLREFTALSAMHRDGWGMAWYDSQGPHSRKSSLQAVDEPDYQRLAASSLGDMGLVHLRWATPGLGINDRNSHPFQHGPYTFAHNGAIHPQRRLGEILPPHWERRLGGTTDSERYFLHIMSRLPERRSDLVAAIGDTAAHIDRLLRPNSLNAVLLAPDALYAICWHYPDRLPVAELRRSDPPHSEEDIAAYFDLAYRITEDAVVVASSGWLQPGWADLPNRHVLVVDRATLQASVQPIGTSETPGPQLIASSTG
ncbi:MAG: class II glutamine amidotransferase [Micromonosporaceae bacterium]